MAKGKQIPLTYHTYQDASTGAQVTRLTPLMSLVTVTISIRNVSPVMVVNCCSVVLLMAHGITIYWILTAGSQHN